ncbi:Conserved_hypothetical protein [Hexamita inflata]|uniref:Uncharacterized protein n=1 Tax=Hexamita inflata TaxID=28002 RepID=A0AA86PQ87_9EUKA|nr:Conserved hypothetical protein [Hexamita inflata]
MTNLTKCEQISALQYILISFFYHYQLLCIISICFCQNCLKIASEVVNQSREAYHLLTLKYEWQHLFTLPQNDQALFTYNYHTAVNFQISSLKCYALVEVQVGSLSINNITVSGSITGYEIYGLVYEAQAVVVINNIIFSLVMNGANSCAFVFKITGSGSVSQNNIYFSGIQNNPIVPSVIVIGLTCPCPLGAWLQKGVCYCTSYSIFDPDSKTCKCISGPLVNGLCCPINSILIKSVCVCQPINTVLDNGECKCTITGQQLANVDSNIVCVCTVSGTYPVSGACKCPQNAYVKDNTCTCPSGSDLVNNICTCSTTNSIINTSAEPICQCPVGSTNSSNSCLCPQNSIIQNEECVCTTLNQFIENGICRCPINGTIICPTGASLIENQCVCTSDYSWGGWLPNGNAWCTNVNLCCTKCLAKLGTTNWGCSDNNYHTCSYSGTTVLDLKRGCTCPEGANLVRNACICSLVGAYPYNNVCQCPTNAFILNNVCTCPTGSSLINGICVCSTLNAYPDLSLQQPACLCPQYSLNISNTCVCPTSSVASGQVCVCQTLYSTMQNLACTCPTNSDPYLALDRQLLVLHLDRGLLGVAARRLPVLQGLDGVGVELRVVRVGASEHAGVVVNYLLVSPGEPALLEQLLCKVKICQNLLLQQLNRINFCSL